MHTPNGSIDPTPQLGTTKSTFRLNQIDKVRALGIGNHVSLPQLVVCGDQSAGKSSVLERLTHIPFPRQDGLCTRFATEIILRHSQEPRKMTATIRADASREPESKIILEAYQKHINDFSELPNIINEVGVLMGLRGYENSDGSAFALDALRIEVCGPTGLHLTIVDLPGLISVANEDQSEEDVRTVHRLVEDYLRSSRTIILAVVQAGNDIANQPIVQKARQFDADGRRTVGIITKPDLINRGTEHRIARLANNEDNVKLTLGFFLLKNPSPEDTAAGLDAEDLALAERNFFAQPSWKQHGVDSNRIGATRLRQFLQDLLQDHIETEIPKVKEELRVKLADSEKELRKLGSARTNIGSSRSFLIERSMCLHQLIQDALHGHYLGANSEFFDGKTRLRALVHQANTEFADEVRLKGQRRTVVANPKNSKEDDVIFMSSSSGESVDEVERKQLSVTRQQMLRWVKDVYRETRGLELPGNYNHNLLTELYQVQSSRWLEIAERHVDRIMEMVKSWMLQALDSTLREDDLRLNIKSMCLEGLEKAASQAHEELLELWADEKRQPVTYNHYYTDNIQKARNDIQQAAVEKAVNKVIDEDWRGKLHVSNISDDIARFTSALQTRVIYNMDDRACTEALQDMEAYYKVARKTFVDNVCRQVVERHILVPLPDLFSPVMVSQMPDEEILRIGSEPEKQQATRQELSTFVDCLQASLKELGRNPQG